MKSKTLAALALIALVFQGCTLFFGLPHRHRSVRNALSTRRDGVFPWLGISRRIRDIVRVRDCARPRKYSKRLHRRRARCRGAPA